MKLTWLKTYNLLIFETVDSTNSEALRLASSGASGDFVILAHSQTAGRGRRGQGWVSIIGNLNSSILLDSPVDPKRHPQLSFVAANAMYEAIATLAAKHNLNLNIELKWPNDVLIDGKKVAGILLEAISFAGKNYVVIGIGANVMASPIIDRPVTCLSDQGIKLDNPDELLDILMNKFHDLYSQWQMDNSFVRTRNDWTSRAYNLNKNIAVDDGVQRISGIFKGIELDGSMRLQLISGEVINLVAGEVAIEPNL